MSIQELRLRTGAGMMACAKAWKDSGSNLEAAVNLIRQRGEAKADGLSHRNTSAGVVGTYLHHNRSTGAMVVLKCETDFVARTPEFQKLADDIAMHVVGMKPMAISSEGLPPQFITNEMEIGIASLKAKGVPEDKISIAMQSVFQKMRERTCLLDQYFLALPAIPVRTVAEAIKELSAKCGEKIEVTKFEILRI